VFLEIVCPTPTSLLSHRIIAMMITPTKEIAAITIAAKAIFYRCCILLEKFCWLGSNSIVADWQTPFTRVYL